MRSTHNPTTLGRQKEMLGSPTAAIASTQQATNPFSRWGGAVKIWVRKLNNWPAPKEAKQGTKQAAVAQEWVKQPEISILRSRNGKEWFNKTSINRGA